MLSRKSTPDPTYKVQIWTVAGYGGVYEFRDLEAREAFLHKVDIGYDRMYHVDLVSGPTNIRPSMVYAWTAVR